MASNNVKAPPYPKTKYTDAKFRDIIPTLPLAECLKIEYRAKGIWFKMISKHAINRYNCECCGIDNIGPMPILDHLRGKKHRLALQVAEKLYHPQYTVAKPTKSPGRTPILDAFTEKEQSFDKSKTKPGPLSSKTKPGPASKPAAPASANAQKSNTDKSNQKPGSDKPNQKPGPASSKKPTNAAVSNNKAAAPTKTTGENAAAKPANVGDTKANTETAKDNNKANDAKESSAEKQNDDTNASGDAKANESKTNDAKPDDGKVSVEKSSETKVGEEKAADTAVDKNEVKQDELKSDDGAKPNDNEVTVVKEFSNEVPEIVILDDDDDDLPASNQSKAKEPAVEAQGKAIPVANTAVPKNQRPPKRGTLNAQQQTQQFPIQQPPAGQIPPADCIINPAAVLAQAASSGDAATTENEKPRYQQNRVIVPTNNRKRGQESSSSNQNKKSSEPNFSKKTFSTKVDAANDIEGIIGVEYVVKILKVYNDPEPFYECCLCEVVMDGTGMQSHLLGYNHRYKYLEKHFPTVFNQQKDHMGNIQVMSFIFERLAKAIEAHHGRELPYECLSGEFRSNRHGVMTTVYSFRHASEYSGPSFTNVIDKKEVDELYQKRLVYNPPKPDPKRKPTFDTRVSVGAPPAAKRGRVEPERPTRNIHGRGRGYRQEPEQNLPVDDATHKLMVEEFLNHTRGKSRSPSSRGGRGRRHRSRSRSRSPHRSSHRRRSVSPLREGDIWQAYRHLVDRSKTELDQMYREYRKDPEKHPNYDEEWRKFWKHRKDQLTREGLDHRNYDFQPEWVRYFAVRIEELYEEAVEDIKISARRRLILPMTNDELKDKKYHVKVATEHESEPQHDHHRARPETDQHRSDNQQQFAIREEKTSVVSVLRLLTALEDYLGSLGPKMVDLLSRALLVEKTNPGEVNEIILNLENCTTLETAMEKLKGVLIAGLLEGPKVKAFNNVITETDKILRIAYKMRRDNPQVAAAHKMAQQRQELPQQQPMVPAPGSQNTMGPGGAAGAGAAANLLSQIDKKELATKLAAALTAQGKTDFNPEQLQQLIAVYSLIDKKKRDSAAATDKQKMTLSDTLTALLNPKGSGGDGGGNFSNMNSDKFSPVNNSSISNFVSMLNNGNSSMGGGGKGGDSEMWQNLQNIQTSLRLQNNPATNVGGGGGAGGGMAIGGFGNNPGNSGRGFGNANQMGGVGGGGGSNFNRGGGYGGGGGGGGDNRGGYPSMDSLEAGFRSGYQGGVNNSNPTRGGGDDMISGGRGVNDMMGGGQRGADMISRGRVGPGQGGNSGGGNSYNSRMGSTGTGANNTLGFSRTSYLGGGAAPNSNYNFPGLSNFSTSITAAPLNSNFSRMGGGSNNNNMGSGGGGGGGAVGGGNNMGGGNFNRNANTNFNSGQNQRNNSRGLGSNWKNQ